MASNSTQMNHVLVTDDDQGPVLAIVTWFLMTVMALAVIARVSIKLAIRRELKMEDFSVIAALLFGIAQSIAVSLALQNGLGQREANLTNADLVAIEQAQYVADLMYILTVALSKISVLLLLRALSVRSIHQKITKVAVFVVIAWSVPTFFTLAFQCGTSQPWAYLTGKCINRLAFWSAIAPVDILTELVVILLPIFMMIPVQVAFEKKVVVVVAFVFRIAVIILTVVRLILLSSYFSSTDPIFNSVASGIATQTLLSMTITTACIPALKPFLDGFESGMLGVSLKTSSAAGTFNANSYEMNNSGNKSVLRSRNRDGEEGGNGGNGITGGYLAAISGQRGGGAGAKQHHHGGHQSGDETNSLDSGKSDAMIIKRTDQWDIRYESANAPSLDPRKEVEDRL